MTDLWQHQVEGVQWAVEAINRHGGALLAWEMGTGKTRAALAVAEAMGARDVLVVCPKSVMRDAWVRQGETQGWSPWVIEGTPAQRDEIARFSGRPLAGGLHIVNYESAWRTPALLERVWDLVIFDEVHRLKSASGKASRWAARVRAQARLGLSGTPTPHSPLDAWPVYRAVTPDRPLGIGTMTAFRARYTRPAQMSEWRDRDLLFRKARGGELIREKLTGLEDLAARMDPLTMRVRADDVLDLPPAVDVVRTVELEPSARRVYRDLERELIAELDGGGEVTAANAMVAMLRLAQVTGGTIRDAEGVEHRVSEAKRASLEDLFADVADEAVVAFGRFHSDLDAIHRAAEAAGRHSYELSGRRHELEPWQTDAEPSVIAVQPQAGGLGVDLTRARICVFYSVGYSLADWLQARARVHRPGQERHVTYVSIVAAGTVDEDVYRALDARERVVEAVLSRLGRGTVRA